MASIRRPQGSQHGSHVVKKLTGAKGSYVLTLHLEHSTIVRVGKLGVFRFSPGLYLYFGSALSGVEHRVRRHLRRRKKRHWHIDYFTKVATAVELWWTDDGQRAECLWARATLDVPGAVAPARGFGSSDCSCNSHLVQLPTDTAVEEVRRRIQAATPSLMHQDLGDDALQSIT